MSLGSIMILTPTIGWATPLLWPVVLTVAGAMGYKQLTSAKADSLLRGEINAELENKRTIELPLEVQVTDAVEEEVKRDQVLRFEKDGIIVTFKRDLRGKFSIRVTGPDSKTKRELEYLGREFMGAVVQQFAYNKMALEMERRGANIVGEEITEEGDIVLKLRRWD